ncbi:hypothetical protein [Actinomyces oricola]|uniref:hypothetical protein n=1 Tax=Actinomyces oricola TaxID=206043 RepID=UPI000FFF062E|nr:hypothetical protein [Actinomyces oricola]
MRTYSTNTPAQVERELIAARTELDSLSASAAPSRLERALERLHAAQEARAAQEDLVELAA